jgi:hypothetical protein
VALDAVEIGTLAKTLVPAAKKEWARTGFIQKRIEGKLNRTWMPDNADLEYKDLLRKASTPWLLFVRDCIAQGCRIDGYTNEQVWTEAWQASGMDGRQGQLNREVIGLGYSFLATLPAEGGGVVMRPLSALKTFAQFFDPWDEYPEYVLHLLAGNLSAMGETRWMLIDKDAVYRFKGDPRRPLELEVAEHGLGFTPVVMIANAFALDGMPESSVAPAIPVYQRIVDATFTLQMVQRYGAFPQKWMAGGEIATDANGNSLVRSSVDGLLHASGDGGESARFGSFASADLNQVVAALESHIKHLSAVSQVPPHYLLGAIANMSAEGIAAAESGYFRNIADRQDSIGEGYELALRTAAAILGMQDAADDEQSQVHWADVATHSIGQIADAVVKLATVNAPLEMLFALIPSWSKTEAIEAAGSARAQAALTAIAAPTDSPT